MKEFGSLMYQEIREQPAILRGVLERNKDCWKEISISLNKGHLESIQLMARGTSSHVAIYTKYLGEYFLGIPVSLMASSIINLYNGPLNLKPSLTIGISQSGKAPDAIGVVEEANRQGGMTLSITNEKGNNLSKVAKYSLYCQAGEEKSVAATKTCTASMMLIGGLIGEWGSPHLMEELKKVPQVLEDIIAQEDHIEMMSNAFLQREECLILGRGFNYAAALETALKIKETSYMNACSYSTADLLHGPIAMINQGLPVLVFAFKGPLLKSIQETIHRLKEIKTEILLVTNEKTLASKDDFYLPFDLAEETTPFASIVIGQLLAYFLAKKRDMIQILPVISKRLPRPSNSKGVAKTTPYPPVR